MEKEKSRRIRRKKIGGIENYSSIIFKIIGLALLSLAVYYYFDTGNGVSIENFSKLLKQNSSKAKFGKSFVFSWEIFSKLISFYIPAILVFLAFTYFQLKNRRKFHFLSLFIIILLTFVHAAIFIDSWLLNYSLSYGNYYVVTGFIVIPTSCFLLNYWVSKKKSILTYTSIYFYLLLFELLIVRYSYTYTYIFCCILLFNITLFLISKKENDTYNNFINYIFAIGFLGIFIIRQLIYNSNTSAFGLFFCINLLYFILYYYISLLPLFQNNKVYHKLFFWLNMLVFLGLNLLIINIHFSFTYLIIPVIGVLVLNSIILYTNNKLPYINFQLFSIEISTLLLLSTFLTLIFPLYSFEVFLGTFSIFLIFYAKTDKNKNLVWISVLFSMLLTFKLSYLTARLLLTAIKLQSINKELILLGFVNVGLILIVLRIIKFQLKSVQFKLSTKLFSRDKIIKFLNFFYKFGLYTFIIWVSFSLLYLVVGNLFYAARVYLISSSLIIIYITTFDKPSYLKDKVRIDYTSFILFIALIILGINEFPYILKFNESYFNVISFEFLFHYLELLIQLVLGYKIISFTREKHAEKNYFKDLIIVVFSLFAILILCKEYDFVYIIYSVISQQNYNSTMISEILDVNQVLPYSIILLVSLLTILLIGIIENNKFLRLFSGFLAFCVLIKIFYIEYYILTKNDKISIIIVTGVTFLLISSVYSRVKKKRNASTIT